MYFHFSNLNRYRVTGLIFSVFLIFSVLNLVFGPILFTYAEDEVSPSELVPTLESAPPLSESTESGTQESSALVVTGDIVSQTGIQSEVNTNVVDTETQNSNQEESQNNSMDLVVQDQNQASVENSANTSAETGDNSAVTENSEALVDTGDAVANTDVVNLVNINLIDSQGSIVAGGDSMGDSSLDLRENLSNTSSSGCSGCLDNVSVSNQNFASVTNDINVTADTGDNSASGENASIITGDAYAGANVVNIVNTNIVKSNYILLVFNNFGNWNGDLIFPSSDFFKDPFSGISDKCLTCGDVDINNSNGANVLNSIQTLANSGDNSASGGSIITGDSLASSNVYNKINTNIYSSSSFYLKIKVFGNWTGNIFNLPENIVWGRTADGLILYDKNSNPFIDPEIQNGNNDLSVSNSNSADVLNNINVSANTGDNSASGENVSIKTGNAYAASNQINIINTNVISSNWTAALVNIFGDWSGNISFGQPDLWIGTVAESSGPLFPGSVVNFITTIKNNGDATARGIKVTFKSEPQFLDMIDGNEWYLSPLAAGESKEIFFKGIIKSNISPDSTITNYTSVSLEETDGNLENNNDTLILSVQDDPFIFLPYNSRMTTYPNLETKKSHKIKSSIIVDGKEEVPFQGSVEYEIRVINHGGLASNGVLYDQLENEAGEIVNQNYWNLDDIQPNEEIIITYTTEFTASSTPGVYKNYAWVEALGGDRQDFPIFMTNVNSNVASDEIILASKPVIIEPEIPEAPKETEENTGEILGTSIEIPMSLDIYNNRTDIEQAESLGGFCKRETNKVPSNTVKSVLASLSFILIIRKRKDIFYNLFI